MANSSLDFFLYSTERFSVRREVTPDPVPPPNEWKIRKPSSPVHWSASFLIRSSARSTTSSPVDNMINHTVHIIVVDPDQ